MQERRQTKQRAALLEALAHAEEPMSAEQLFLKLQPQFPRLALSTVYRNVERMVEEGAVQKELTEDGVFFIWVTGPARSLFNLPQLPKKGEADTLPIGIGGKTAE